ncbi:hypothetical protein BGW36DRAFT_393515 [Talaromyces proteolyticus]|uniref:Uncharacterized protein n=1 Tax=Talaromyces proteolyticus TaxID=1131652 RepID=A0AAD4L216_9EURO|nr:uncharacterized protein BGW36DRAFT_393515 [Talaromyces proteolyticus]KAH8703059.1 hypothetical protein BGW36DRAFT_393515 [Talaromyces proteolyticus]
MPLCNGFKLDEASIDDLLHCYLERIYQVLTYLKYELDVERKLGKIRGLLHGIPFLMTAGGLALIGSIVLRDAHVIQRLLHAASGRADMRSSDYFEGYSAGRGQCRNPYILLSMQATAAGGPPLRWIGLTSRAGAIPGPIHQDSVGCFGKLLAMLRMSWMQFMESIHGTTILFLQQGETPRGGYAQFPADKSTLKNAVFGLLRMSLWHQLIELPDLIENAGAAIINGTEFLFYPRLDFYNNIKSYLTQLENSTMRSLEGLEQFNLENVQVINLAFASEQDGFLESLATKAVMDGTNWESLHYCQHTTREGGIDAALKYKEVALTALLVSGMPYGLALIATLIRYAGAIENLQRSSDTPWKRRPSTWSGYWE